MMQFELEKAIRYVEANLENELSLNEVAQHCNYSPYHFSVLFHQYFGETLKSYIKKRRLTLAAEHLKHTEIIILHIAIKYGYSSQAAFSRAFTDLFGITPHKYRQTQVPIQETNQKTNSPFYEKGSETMNATIKKLQEKIEAKAEYSVNILHILNGSHMLNKFKTNKLMNSKATYVSFNEAMCWGEADTEIFSQSFIDKRVKSLRTTEEGYRGIVIEALKPLFEEKFDIIVLWFGDDMFCQMNLMTIVAYLEQMGYSGDVLFCMALERTDEMLDEAYELDIKGYLEVYKAAIVNHQKPASQTMPVTYQAINMYLTYREEQGPIVKYIRSHTGDENLINSLLNRFPEYGLGDLQYHWLIEEYQPS